MGHHVRTRARRTFAAALLGLASTLAVGTAAPQPASGLVDQAASFSGLGCTTSSTTNSSTWGSATAPAGTVQAFISITGGGGAGGDDDGGDGGDGGRGGVVTATFSVSAGQVLWAKIGCGGTDADSWGDWSGRRADGYNRGGGAEDFGGGGGGGSTAVCLGTSTASCGGGAVLAIAGGGGGGGNGANGGFGDNSAGSGGNANQGGFVPGQQGGYTRGGGRGNNGNGSENGYGGGGGGGGGQGPGQNTGATTGNNSGGVAGSRRGGGQTNGEGATSVPPPTGAGEQGAGGRGSNGENDVTGGGGGGGFTGGGGGGGGRQNVTVYDGAGGGGAGASWVKDGSVSSNTDGMGGGLANCSNAGLGTNPGYGGTEGGRGCHGNVSVTWKVNRAPTGANQTSGTATKGVGLGINLGNADLDGDSRSCQVVGTPSKGSVSISGCTATYTASANTSGNGGFQYRVVDSWGATSSTHDVTVPIGNRAPTGAATSVAAARQTSFAIGALTATDPDGDSPLTCSVVSGPSKGSLSGFGCGGGTYTVTPGDGGSDSFTYKVADAYGGESTTYTVSITGIGNRAPTAQAQSVAVDAGSPTTITLTGTDADSDAPLTCQPGTPGKGALTGSGCSRTYTSNAGTANAGVGGSDSFTFTVTDPLGAVSSPATVGVTIANPDLSLTKSHTGRFNEGVGTGTYTLTVGNTTSAPANGTTTLTDTLPAGMTYRSSSVGSSGFSCSGTPGVSTTVTCTRSTAIAEGASLSLTITVDVAAGASSPLTNQAVVSSLYELAATAADNAASDPTDVNHRPSGADQAVGTDIDVAVLVALTGIDPDGDALTFVVGTEPSNGSLFGSGANRQYVPNTGFTGVDTFTYSVTDTGTPGLTSATYTVTIHVGVSRLTGVVTDEVSGLPVAGVEARLVDMADPQAGVLVATVATNGSGAYDFGAVPFGTYGVRFVDPSNDHISEWYDDAPTSATANLFTLDAGAPTVSRSVALRPGGRITGTIRSTEVPNAPIEGLQVRLVKIGSTGSQAKTTTASGGYAFELLQPGSYQVWFRDLNALGWISEWYGDVATQGESTVIEVAVGQQITIDELIQPVAPPPPPDSGSVTGTVTDSVTGAPLAGVQVRLYKDPYTGSASTTTDANGQYAFTRLAPASYRLWFRDMTGTRISEYGGDASTLAEADTLSLANDGHIVDATLAPKVVAPPPNSGVISGTVLEVDGFTPVVGLQVRLYAVGGTGSKATTTLADGSYAFTGLAPGQYQVFFRDLGRTWFSEWHLDSVTQAASTAVAAVNGQTTDIDATLNRR